MPRNRPCKPLIDLLQVLDVSDQFQPEVACGLMQGVKHHGDAVVEANVEVIDHRLIAHGYNVPISANHECSIHRTDFSSAKRRWITESGVGRRMNGDQYPAASAPAQVERALVQVV